MFSCRFCLSHILPFIMKAEFAYQRQIASARQQPKRLVSNGGDRWECCHFCKCTNTVCVLLWWLKRCCEVLGGAGWPFGRRRGGITVTVWQSGPQRSCNGWALSRWTPLLPLFSPPHYLVPPPFFFPLNTDTQRGAHPLLVFASYFGLNDGRLLSFSYIYFLWKCENVSFQRNGGKINE